MQSPEVSSVGCVHVRAAESLIFTGDRHLEPLRFKAQLTAAFLGCLLSFYFNTIRYH